MGLILDSSIVIDAERRRETVAELIERVLHASGDQNAALSSVGLVELTHGIYRATTREARRRREVFIEELLASLVVHPFTKEMALLAGRLNGEQQQRGIVIPFADLLIGSTALALGFSLLTVNVRHFQRIPGLNVVQL